MEYSVFLKEHFFKSSELGNMHNFVNNSVPFALSELCCLIFDGLF